MNLWTGFGALVYSTVKLSRCTTLRGANIAATPPESLAAIQAICIRRILMDRPSTQRLVAVGLEAPSRKRKSVLSAQYVNPTTQLQEHFLSLVSRWTALRATHMRSVQPSPALSEHVSVVSKAS